VIVVDTNVISEAVKPEPSMQVIGWLRAEPPAALFTTAITEAELLYGLALLRPGSRRRSLEEMILGILSEDFAGRILPFDSAAAREHAQISSARRSLGRPMSEADARIAAIARSRGASVATRNVADFKDAGITIVDPWR
jgi:predicted nucleic acid-binding protein